MAIPAALYVTYLRVYEPMPAFSPADHERWRTYLATDPPSDPAVASEAEWRESLRALLAVPPRLPTPVIDGSAARAWIRRIDGVWYLCPRDTWLRSLLAVASLGRGTPAELLDATLTRTLSREAEAELERLLEAGGAPTRPHALTSRWHIPAPWFMPFAPGERRLHLGRRGDADRSVRYLTPMAEARRRTARALAALRKGLDDGPILRDVEELGRWLEEFHPHAVVELDYGGLVHLLDDATLRADTSVAEIAEGLAALADGDGERAFASYRKVMARWEPVRALEHAS